MPDDPARIFAEERPNWGPPLVMPEGVQFRRGVPVGRAGERELTTDLFLPPEGFAELRPAMLYIYGGGWRSGTPSHFYRQAARLAAHGVVGVCTWYRLSGEAPFPAAVQDCKCAVRWMRAAADELGIDPERIGVAGGSAGGHLAAMVLTTAHIPELEGDGGHAEQSSAVCMGVPFNPITDVVNFHQDGSPLPGWVPEFLGVSFEEDPAAWHLCSPLEHVGPDTPPCMLVHGTADEQVPHDHSERFAEAARAAGVECELVLVDDQRHGFFNWEPYFEPIYERFERFVLSHL